MGLSRDLCAEIDREHASGNEYELFRAIDSWALKLSKHDSDVAAVLTEHAWLVKDKYRADGGAKFSAWLTTVLKRRAIDEWRKQGTHKEPILPWADENLDEDSDEESSARDAQEYEAWRVDLSSDVPLSLAGLWLDCLDERTKGAFSMVIDGRSKVDIAAFLGIAPGSVDVTLHRMREATKKRFGVLLRTTS